MHVAIYARVSTTDRDQNPETQLRPLREHVARLPENILLGEFVDRASADDLRGPREWRRVLALAHQRRVDLVVVWKLDRAFRSVADGATTLQTLRTCGCGLHSLQEPWIDTTTALGDRLRKKEDRADDLVVALHRVGELQGPVAGTLRTAASTRPCSNGSARYLSWPDQACDGAV